MSISLYTGTPGSGKSFHAAKDIEHRMRRGGTLICNFPVNTGFVKKCRAQVEYWDNSELTAERLVAYALEHHKIGKEGQALVVIDECQIIFNCRDFGRKDRNAWVTFFSQHRKLGFNIILITQSDRMLDKQIRSLVEDEVKHRKLNNYGFGGMFPRPSAKLYYRCSAPINRHSSHSRSSLPFRFRASASTAASLSSNRPLSSRSPQAAPPFPGAPPLTRFPPAQTSPPAVTMSENSL